VTGGVEETAGRLLNRVEALERELGESQADTTRTARSAAELRDEVHRLEHGTERALRNLEGDVAALRTGASAQADGTAALLDRIERGERAAHARLAERDRRVDSDERTLQQVTRDVAAVHRAVPLLHAPVPAGAEVVLCDAGALLVPADDVVAPWLAYHRSWEPDEAALMTELMASYGEPVGFLDVGAHVGYHTLRLLAETPVAGVVAVEANPDTVALLRRNLALNLPADTAGLVTVLPVAAWDEPATVRLAPAEPGNSGDHRVHAGGSEGVEVAAVRLDAEPGVRALRIGVVKVDLQGRDHRALAGLTEVLERDRPHVVCEFDPGRIAELGDDPEQVLLGYRKLGYQPVPLGPDGRVDAQDEHADADLVAAATAAEPGFLTLWLRPAD
jgi:FkbM family methyltransferase